MKRSQIKRRPLADSVLKTLEPEAKAFRELDGNSLYFEVKPSGSKSWVLRYKRPDKKWAWKGIGGFPAVSGKAARRRALDLLDLVADGEDLRVFSAEGVKLDKAEPVIEKILFKEVAEDWYNRKKKAGRSADTLKQYRSYLDREILPRIGDKPLDEITRADCSAIQDVFEERGAYDIAKKIRGWINQMFSLAVGQGKCENNPASELKHIAQEKPEKRNYPFLLEPELPAFLKALRASTSRPITLHMVWLVLRTACRPGMARWAEWAEFNLKKAEWKTPGEKMKMKVEHIIPLSRQTVRDLEELHKLTGQSRWLFPGNGWVHEVLSENTVNQALTRIGYKNKLVGHGARHTASTLLNDHGWNFHVVEAQLAHKLQGVAGVYNKAKYLTQRQQMMQWYSDYLGALETGGEKPKDPVIQLPQ